MEADEELMPPFTGKPMDLANLRGLGLSKIMAYCRCGHSASIDVSRIVVASGGTLPPRPLWHGRDLQVFRKSDLVAQIN
jgi:hypothetical protein